MADNLVSDIDIKNKRNKAHADNKFTIRYPTNCIEKLEASQGKNIDKFKKSCGKCVTRDAKHVYMRQNVDQFMNLDGAADDFWNEAYENEDLLAMEEYRDVANDAFSKLMEHGIKLK